MAIANVYATYRECGVSSLSGFSFSHAKRHDLACSFIGSIATECVWIQTCNRVELYLALADGIGTGDIRQAMRSAFGDSGSELSVRYDDDAVHHLFNVATMLDSMIVGEQQILGQMRSAMLESESWGMLGHALRPLFTRAMRAGKRARTETAISAGNVSMASIAVSMAEEYVGTLLDADCLVLGAGKISRMIAKILFQKGATRVHISNRTDEKAEALAEETGAIPLPFARFKEHLPFCDVLFCASSAPHSLIHEATMRTALSGRSTPLVVVDVAMPPDVESAAADMDGVTYFGLDAVRGYARVVEASRIREVPLVENIVEEEERAYRKDLYLRERKSAIRSISTHLERIRTQELGRLLSQDGLTPDAVDAFSKSVLKKAFHILYMNIQYPSCPPELVHAARELLLSPYVPEK